MCKAFSCIVKRDATVLWKFGTDSHTDLLQDSGLKDDTNDPMLMEFARVEVSPKNANYLFPDVWELHVDQSITPAWFGQKHKDAANAAHAKWMKKLDKILVRKQIVHPFKIEPPKEITKQHINMLRKWASVWDSVRDSVRDSVGDSVRDSVGDSVRDSVRDSVGASVWDSVGASVWDSVGAYVGSFFILPVWKYIKHPRGKYPFAPCVQLWERGLVPSFDGKTWRLHGGPKAVILFEITAEELRK